MRIPAVVCFAALLGTLSTHAQSNDTATVEGHVIDAATGAPLRKATVQATRADASPNLGGATTAYSVSTDGSGSFSLRDIEPGSYRLTAARNGFVPATYGARGPLRSGTFLGVGRGAQIKDIEFKLTPQAVVTGRIVDEDGEPVPFAAVQLQGFRYQQGKRHLGVTGWDFLIHDVAGEHDPEDQYYHGQTYDGKRAPENAFSLYLAVRTLYPLTTFHYVAYFFRTNYPFQFSAGTGSQVIIN